MEQADYKDFKTSRGFNYHYFFSHPSQPSKPICLLLHGFPSTSYDWRHQVPALTQSGYGAIVPDMLGYGGTDEPGPDEVEEYKMSLMCRDLADILDHEKVDKAVVIGHDWGSTAASRFVNRFPERVSALAPISVGYRLPNHARVSHEELIANFKAKFGTEVFGYWLFFSEPDAPALIKQNFESFFSFVHAKDFTVHKEHLMNTGAARKWIESGRTVPYADYLTEKDKKILSDQLLKGGLAGPLNWYKAYTSEIAMDDDATIPKDRVQVQQPCLFVVATQDEIAKPLIGLSKATAAEHCPNLTVREFEGPHYVHLHYKDEVNEALLEWMRSVGV